MQRLAITYSEVDKLLTDLVTKLIKQMKDDKASADNISLADQQIGVLAAHDAISKYFLNEEE